MTDDLKQAEKTVSEILNGFVKEGLQVPSSIRNLMVDWGTRCYLEGKTDGFRECKEMIKKGFKDGNKNN